MDVPDLKSLGGSLKEGGSRVNDDIDTTPRLLSPQLAFKVRKETSESELDELPANLKAKKKYTSLAAISSKRSEGEDGAKMSHAAVRTVDEDFSKPKSKHNKRHEIPLSDSPFVYPHPKYVDNFLLNEILWPLMLWLDSFRVLVHSDWMCAGGGAILIVGIIAAAIAEICQGGATYNVFLLLVLYFAREYSYFPAHTMRPHIVIALITLISIFVDFFTFTVKEKYEPTQGVKILTGIVVLVKLFALYNFLKNRNDDDTVRARKYLNRRFRIFCFPFRLPRRLMREIRNRIIGLEVVQLFLGVVFLSLFIISITSMGYNMNVANPHSVFGISPAVFLFVKAITSMIVFGGLFVDTDVFIVSAYFGCLGCFSSYAKDYILQKKNEYGGWPLSYFYNPMRFRMVSYLKLVDFVWSLVGWITIVFSIGESYTTMSDSLKLFFVSITLSLVLSDIWTPILWFSVRWLTGKQEEVESMGIDPDSDDSELDELGVRDTESISGSPITKHGSNSKVRNRGRGRKLRQIEESEDDSDDSDGDDEDDSRLYKSQSMISSSYYSSSDDGSDYGDEDLDGSINIGNINVDLSESDDGVGNISREALDQWGSPHGRVGKTLRQHPTPSPIMQTSGMKQRHQQQQHQQQITKGMVELVMDPRASIAPDVFSSKWPQQKTAGRFACEVDSTSTKDGAFHVADLIAHLKSQGFFIVAAGKHGIGGFKIYFFAIAYNAYDNSLAIEYFSEICMSPSKNLGKWALICCSKVNPDYATFFVAQLNLGVIFTLS